ncbi:MAG: PAS domain S-box protein [Campylobacterales bacterium]|nr:PAS domain S-box protein [Campylobacterales bacterium]
MRISVNRFLYFGTFIGTVVVLSLFWLAASQIKEMLQITERFYNHSFIVTNNIQDVLVDTRALLEITTKSVYQDETPADVLAQMKKIQFKIDTELQTTAKHYLGNPKDVETIRATLLDLEAQMNQALLFMLDNKNLEAKSYLHSHQSEALYLQISDKINVVLNFAYHKSDELKQSTVTKLENDIISLAILSLMILFSGILLAIKTIRYSRREFETIHITLDNIKNEVYLPIEINSNDIEEFHNLKSSINHMLSTIVLSKEKIQSERQRCQALMKYSSDGIFIMGIDGSLKECSQRAANMLGYSMEEMLKLNVYDWDTMIPVNELPTLIDSIQIQTPMYFETKHKRKDGSIYDAAITATKINIGENILLYASTRDITHQKIIENELLETNKKLSTIAANIPGVVYTYQLFPDGRSCFPYASEHIYDIYGVTPQEVEEDSTKVFSVLHPEDLNHVAKTIQISFEELTLWEVEYRVIHPDRGILWVRGIAKPEKQSDNSVLWYGYIYDITESKLAELAIENAKSYYETLLEYASDGVHILDADGNIIAYSRSFAQYLGYEYDEVKNLNVKDWDSGIPKEQLSDIIKELMSNPRTFETKHSKKDGTILDVQISSQVVDYKNALFSYFLKSNQTSSKALVYDT